VIIEFDTINFKWGGNYYCRIYALLDLFGGILTKIDFEHRRNHYKRIINQMWDSGGWQDRPIGGNHCSCRLCSEIRIEIVV